MELETGKVFIVGGRRGFGKAIVSSLQKILPKAPIVTSSRFQGADYLFDLSRSEVVPALLEALDFEKPQRVFFIAGGGPYGLFSSKEWKDHLWALQVSLLSPMQVAHHCLQRQYCQQLIFIGSAIAEANPDSLAASYCAAKHGLKGFISTLVQEYPQKDIRLYSPGYMSTDMLPVNAAAKTGKPIVDPHLVANDFVEWVITPKAAWHKMYTP